VKAATKKNKEQAATNETIKTEMESLIKQNIYKELEVKAATKKNKEQAATNEKIKVEMDSLISRNKDIVKETVQLKKKNQEHTAALEASKIELETLKVKHAKREKERDDNVNKIKKINQDQTAALQAIKHEMEAVRLKNKKTAAEREQELTHIKRKYREQKKALAAMQVERETTRKKNEESLKGMSAGLDAMKSQVDELIKTRKRSKSSCQVKIEGSSKKRKHGDDAASETSSDKSTILETSIESPTTAVSTSNVQTVSCDQLKTVEETIVWCEYVTEMLDSKRCQECKPKLCSTCKQVSSKTIQKCRSLVKKRLTSSEEVQKLLTNLQDKIFFTSLGYQYSKSVKQ